MRLRTFYVKSYRSIVEATLEDIQNYSVIVGPNNAGKSNLLRAIFVSLSIALEGDFQRSRRNRQYSYAYSGEQYSWERDIPVSLRDDDSASTVFKLTFEFSENEKQEFKTKFGINLSKSIQMKFQLFKRSTEYNIIMPGRAKRPMEEKMREIGLFIRSKLDYEYIPCLRSTEFTAEYFSRLLNKEFRQLEEQDAYKRCIETIRTLQAPVIDRLENKLTTSLKTFLPDIARVKLPRTLASFGFLPRRTMYSYQNPIVIDDGALTSLEDKGDGVKSLAAIGIVQSLSFENARDHALILCIEEPEAHLHPDAVHSLRNIILEISSHTDVQVIISTHSPILVDRDDTKNNIVVCNNHRIKPCTSIADVREVLGVRLQDNLSAPKVVLVEGISDKRYFEKLFVSMSPSLADKLEKGQLEIVDVGSATKMDYQIKLYNSATISTIVLLDSDDSGLETQRKLTETKTKLPNEVLMIKSAGMKKCELEDIVAFDMYFDAVLERFNINLDCKKFTNRKKPWSDRLHEAAEHSAGVFNADIENQIKEMLADIVVQKGIDSIAAYDREYVQNLVKAVELFAEK